MRMRRVNIGGGQRKAPSMAKLRRSVRILRPASVISGLPFSDS